MSTSLRAPGEVQGPYIAESIVENVASSLNMDVDVVTRINVHTYESLRKFYTDEAAGEADEYTLPLLWDKLEISSDFKRRAESVKEFNRSSIKSTPGKVDILCDGSVLIEVAGTEIGQGLWTKTNTLNMTQSSYTAQHPRTFVKQLGFAVLSWWRERLKPTIESDSGECSNRDMGHAHSTVSEEAYEEVEEEEPKDERQTHLI
ncbi:unnamed protein product [Thlaspi arvense]|uniref:Uncharacterized protein n=1 Tax=Thlaspi arvense TaxID=13288 RepID=A0AAU9RUJ6_THLAR|nr:unnamed protein product [Thlaspi arvense]